MIDIKEMYAEAEESDVIIIDEELKSCEAMSVCDEGMCLVAIDPHKVKDCADRRVKMAHELGHCKTGAFYNMYSKHNVISKNEYKADKWAIQRLMPIDELLSAVEEGYTEVWELAEYFGVTETFVRRAYEIYTAMGIFTNK